MERSDKILATKKQILPYNSLASPPLQQQRNQSLYPLPPLLPQLQSQSQIHYPHHLILPNLNINNNDNNNFILHDTNQNMADFSGYITSTSSSNLPVHYFNQFDTPNPSTASTATIINNYSPSYGSRYSFWIQYIFFFYGLFLSLNILFSYQCGFFMFMFLYYYIQLILYSLIYTHTHTHT